MKKIEARKGKFQSILPKPALAPFAHPKRKQQQNTRNSITVTHTNEYAYNSQRAILGNALEKEYIVDKGISIVKPLGNKEEDEIHGQALKNSEAMRKSVNLNPGQDETKNTVESELSIAKKMPIAFAKELNIKLCDTMNNKIVEIAVPLGPRSLDTKHEDIIASNFAILKEYFERTLANSCSKGNLQKSLIITPCIDEASPSLPGLKKDHVKKLSNKLTGSSSTSTISKLKVKPVKKKWNGNNGECHIMMVKGKGPMVKGNSISLTRLLLSQNCYVDLEEQEEFISKKAEQEKESKGKLKNLHESISINAVDVKRRLAKQYAGRGKRNQSNLNPLEECVKQQLISGLIRGSVDIAKLGSEKITPKIEAITELVDISENEKGVLIIRPKQEKSFFESPIPIQAKYVSVKTKGTKISSQLFKDRRQYSQKEIARFQSLEIPQTEANPMFDAKINVRRSKEKLFEPVAVASEQILGTPRMSEAHESIAASSLFRKVSFDSHEKKKKEKGSPAESQVKSTLKQRSPLSPKKKAIEIEKQKGVGNGFFEAKSTLINMLSLQELPLSTYLSQKEPTTIKILHTDYQHLKDHPINRTLNCLNQFIAASFKNKETTLDTKLIARLGKVFNIHFPAGKNGITIQLLKNKELAQPLKERLLKSVNWIINSENEIGAPITTSKAPLYKFYICTGNNGVMVRGILKQRWWWTYGEKCDESLNLFWTQWAKKSFIQALPQKKNQKLNQESLSLPEEKKAEGPSQIKNISMESESETNSSKQLATPKGKKVIIYQIPSATAGAASPIVKMCNHLECHYHLSNKKAMFFNMMQYYDAMKKDPFDTLPLTYHIRAGVDDIEFQKFTTYYQMLEGKLKESLGEKEEQSGLKMGGGKTAAEKNIWIIKPGENTNRGVGIQVVREYEEIKKIIGNPGDSQRTFIIQKYIERPLLISKRKFDIRMYALITSINGLIKGYFYEEGYLRTSSKEYTLKNLAKKTIHLTNDAVQNRAEDYGKYEAGNKLSFTDFQRYLDSTYASLHIDFYRDLLPQIKVSY